MQRVDQIDQHLVQHHKSSVRAQRGSIVLT
jgi:hypothetical protein